MNYSGVTRGENIKVSIRISLEEAYHGTKRPLLIPNYPVRCPKCSKFILYSKGRKQCDVCGGMGVVKREECIQVCIPAGIDTHQSIRIKNHGMFGNDLKDENRGDLLIQVFVEEHPVFARKEYMLFSTINVNGDIAEHGGEMVVDTIDGKINLKIFPGIREGTKIKIEGKGMPTLRDQNVRGDMYVIVKIDV